MIYKISVRTSQETLRLRYIDNRLILFKETIAVCENPLTLGQNVVFSMLQQVIHINGL
jgi:hypothetical protein